jgi:hypothetical protein
LEKTAMYSAVADELVRRVAAGRWPGIGLMADAEVWVEPQQWLAIRTKLAQAVGELHEAARPPRTPGTIRTSTTVALFEMESE